MSSTLFFSPVSIFMMISWSSQSHLLLISVSLCSLAMASFCSFIWEMFLSPHVTFLGFCVSATSLALKDNRLIRKEVVP